MTNDDKAKERLLSLMNSELFAVKKLFEQKYTVEYDIPNKTARIKNVDLSDLDLIFATALKEIEGLETKHEKFVNDAYDGIKKQEEENRQLQRTIDDLKKELEESEGRYLDTLNELLDIEKGYLADVHYYMEQKNCDKETAIKAIEKIYDDFAKKSNV